MLLSKMSYFSALWKENLSKDKDKAMKTVAKSLGQGLEVPDSITSTKLRKYTETMSQVWNCCMPSEVNLPLLYSTQALFYGYIINNVKSNQN